MFVFRCWSNIIFSFVAMLIMIDCHFSLWLSLVAFSLIHNFFFFTVLFMSSVRVYISTCIITPFWTSTFEIHCAQLQRFHILPSLRNESWMIPARSDKAFSKEQRFLHFPYRSYMTISVMGGFYFMSAEFSCEFLFVMCTSLKSSILLL